MNGLYYIGLDVHKKHVSYVIKTAAGECVGSGQVAATRAALSGWAASIKRPWSGALEATLFSGWIYDHLRPHAEQLELAHPAMLKAISCSKKKNDRLDADKICDLLRCELLPRCYLAPPELRELRRVLRYRNLLVGEAVRMKNKISGLLMEVGEPYDARRLHGKKYFSEYMGSLEETPESVVELWNGGKRGGNGVRARNHASPPPAAHGSVTDRRSPVFLARADGCLNRIRHNPTSIEKSTTYEPKPSRSLEPRATLQLERG